MKTYTLSLFFFHITVVHTACLAWAKPLLETNGGMLEPTEVGLDLGKLTVFVTPGRPAYV